MKLIKDLPRHLVAQDRPLDTLDEDLAVLGEAVSLFIRIWLSSTPTLPESAQAGARAKGAERFEGFMQMLGKRLATGDRFLKELSRDMPPLSMQDDPAGERAADESLNNPSR